MYTLPVGDKGCSAFKCTSAGIITLMMDVLLRNHLYLHTRGVIPTVSPWVLHPAVPPHSPENSCSNCPCSNCLLCPAWEELGHCKVIPSIVKTGLTAATSFTLSLNSDFSSRFLLLHLKSCLVIPCLLFKPVDWSSFFFMCNSLSLADTLMRVLVVSFTACFLSSFLP